jgi:Resolvase, N terminal domain
LHDIPRNLPFRVEMWDRADQHVRWVIAPSASVAVRHAAMDAAIANYPGQRFTLRNGILVTMPSLASLEAGDTLLVTKLDRLARSTRDLLNTLAAINEKGASFKSRGDAWADTTTPHGRLMVTVLGGLAEFERHLILTRTHEGRVRAKARGVKFGRKPKLTAYQRQEALARLAQGETLTAIVKSMAVSHMTISQLEAPGA